MRTIFSIFCISIATAGCATRLDPPRSAEAGAAIAQYRAKAWEIANSTQDDVRRMETQSICDILALAEYTTDSSERIAYLEQAHKRLERLSD